VSVAGLVTQEDNHPGYTVLDNIMTMIHRIKMPLVLVVISMAACEGTLDPGAQDAAADLSRDSALEAGSDLLKTKDLHPQDLLGKDKAPPPDKALPPNKAPTKGLVLSDPLISAAMTSGENGKWVKGGKFSSGGWLASDGKSQIMIQLKTALKNAGTVKIDVTNFAPLSQNTGEKHEIINLYTQKNGSKDIFNTKGSWWNIRTGTNYASDPMAIKFLSALNGTRTETRLKTKVTWSKSKTYTFRVSWSSGGISIYLDSQKIQQHPWGNMVESFEYVFIGTNNVYTAQPGPIYSNLRVYNY